MRDMTDTEKRFIYAIVTIIVIALIVLAYGCLSDVPG